MIIEYKREASRKELIERIEELEKEIQELKEEKHTNIVVCKRQYGKTYGITKDFISKDKIREIISKKRTKALERYDNYLNDRQRIFKKNIQVAMLDTLLKELLEEN